VQEDPDCCVIGKVPDHLLFPKKMAVVVHHGGAGTTATAARAGTPHVIVPHMTDQHYWANQVNRLRLGAAPIRRSRLSRKNLSEAWRHCVNDPGIRANCAQMAAALRDKDDVSRAVRCVSDLLPAGQRGQTW
jgi:UDP:flavonoid glycosyltransferase YjiC (YdhE family)